MRESKGVYVPRNDFKDHHRKYQVLNNRVIRKREYSLAREKYDTNTQEVGCQYDFKTDNIICRRYYPTSRRRQEVRYFSGLPKHIYTYHGSRSYTDIGVGSIKAVPRKRVQRLYLPETDERGVGNSELSSFLGNRRTRQNNIGSYYDHKKTSSKCVGGVIEYNTGCTTSAKLSPIIHTRSRTTSPVVLNNNDINSDIGTNTVEKSLITMETILVDYKYANEEVNVEPKKPEDKVSAKNIVEEVNKQNKTAETITSITENDKSRVIRHIKGPDKTLSSDSLLQHVHNLEMPSDDKHGRLSSDPMENKLEREYRKMFAIKSKESKPSSEKPIPDFKSASMLRRRFEALRRGIIKKEESKRNAVIDTTISPTSDPSCKDVSIVSDPPSLEGRSYSNTKTYSPFPSNVEYNKDIYDPSTSYKKSSTGAKTQDSTQWSRLDGYDGEYQGAKGMFKLWGKKFDLEEDNYDDKKKPKPPFDIPKIIEKDPETIKVKSKEKPQEKKEGKKFLFFKRKTKDKAKQPYKSKKGVTTGRCEVRDGLIINIGTTDTYNTKDLKKPEKVSTEYEDILQEDWLTKYMTKKIDSRKSVQVRWNNKTYATSSSTIFELMDSVYKETGVALSKSEVSTGESSYYKSFTRHRVNFMQNIDAWMIPKTIPDRPKVLPIKNNGLKKNDIEVRISNQKWFIDKSKAFSHNIEVVFHSNNFVKVNNESSSQYLRIDIPKGFFVDSCSEDDHFNHSSIEEVYKIVEYESTTDMKKQIKIVQKFDEGDHVSNDINVTVSIKDSKNIESKILETVIKSPLLDRDVVIQGSNVYIPRRCDVIGVGIITQRDLREMKKPILKIHDDEISDEESDQILQITPKKCEFAESYLHDYYRNWTPLGMDLFSWCVSDSNLRCSSENSQMSFNHQEDGSKSCPNIYDDFHTSAVFSSCGTSSCSHCNYCDDEKADLTFASKVLNLLKKKPKEAPEKRYLPKDSLEVLKRRKIYAESNKGNWGTVDDKPCSVPDIDDESPQKDTMIECPTTPKPCCKPVVANPKKKEAKKKGCNKHVSLPGCETIDDILRKQEEKPEGILTYKGASGCDACKKHSNGGKCPKHAMPADCCESNSPPSTRPCKIPSAIRCTPRRSQSPTSSRASPCRPCILPSPINKPSLPCIQSCPPCHANTFSQQPCSPDECSVQKLCPTPPWKKTKSPRRSQLKCKPEKKSSSTLPPTPSPPLSLPQPPLMCPQCSPSNDVYPWPVKQVCSQPSIDSYKLIICKNESCPIKQLSSQSLETKECIPDCANRSRFHSLCPQKSKTKLSGLHLKMFGKQNVSSKEFVACTNDEEKASKLPSQESVIISIKQDSGSTEEIRGGVNIIVKDADSGRILYERNKYNNIGCCGLTSSMAGNMYSNNVNSNVHRMSAPITVKNVTPETQGQEALELKSDTSVTHLVEILFKVRATHANKTTAINVVNDIDNEAEKSSKSKNQDIKSPQRIYVIKNEGVHSSEDINSNNDINIRIVIKSYKPQNKSKSCEIYDDVFSKKISEKYQTVSTGYSDLLDRNSDNVYSVRHTTVDVKASVVELENQNKPSAEVMAEEFAEREPINLMVSSHSAKCDTDQVESKTDEDITEKSISSKKEKLSSEQIKEIEDLSELSRSHGDIYDNLNVSDTYQNVATDLNTSNESDVEVIKLHSNDNKKEMLMNIFEKINNKKQNKKKKVKKLRDMLKQLLTSDSSAPEDMAHASSHELAKDVTSALLEPNYFRDKDSMSNFYKIVSTPISSIRDSKVSSIKLKYPTKERNSFCSRNSDDECMENKDPIKKKCMCNALAARLNLCKVGDGKGCCCRANRKISKQTNCDIKNDEDVYILNYATSDYADVETQNSINLTSKMNSALVLIDINTQSNEIKLVESKVDDINKTQDKKEISKIFSPYKNRIKDCEMMKLNRNTILKLTDEDKIVFLETKQEKVHQEQSKTLEAKESRKNRQEIKCNEKKPEFTQNADALQSYQTKKAVLEIYAQKTIKKGSEHIVAKLPKFAYERESVIRQNYKELAANGYISICKRNYVLMSINR